MKQLSIVLLGVFLIATSDIMSQCDTVVPANAIVYSTQTTHATNGSDIWLCDGVKLTVTGKQNTIYAEGNNTIIIDNTGNDIFAKGPGNITLDQGFSGVYHESNVTVTDNSSANIIQQCSAVTFDYTNAPTSGCDIYAGIDINELTRVTLFPNPALDVLNLNIPDHMSIESLSIYTMNGQLMQSTNLLNGNKSIDISDLSQGLYMLSISSSNGIKMIRFVKN